MVDRPAALLSTFDAGAIPGGTNVNISAGFDAFFASTTVNDVWLDPGTWSFNYLHAMVNGDKNKRIWCDPEANLLCTDNSSAMFDVWATPVWTEAVSAITMVDAVSLIDDAVNDVATVNRIARLTIAGARTVVKGDVLKLVCDNVIPEGGDIAQVTKKQRLGEFVTVGVGSSGTSITLTSCLMELKGAYVTNVRVALMPTCSLEWHGGTCDYDASQVNIDETMPVISLSGIRDALVEGCRPKRLISAFVQLNGTYDAVVRDIRGRTGLNMSFYNHYSTLVHCFGDSGTRASDLSAGTTRHPLTTGAYPIDANTTGIKFHLYGRNRGLSTHGLSSHACQHAVADFHDEAIGGSHVGGYAERHFAGQNSPGAGITIRGAYNKAQDCTTYACRIGAYLASYKSGHMINCNNLHCQLYAIQYNIGNSSTPQDVHCDITGGIHEVFRDAFTDTGTPIMRVNSNATLNTVSGNIIDATFKYTSSAQCYVPNLIEINSAGTWYFRNLHIDLSDLNVGLVGAHNMALFYIAVDDVHIVIDGLRFTYGSAGNTVIPGLYRAISNSPNTSVVVHRTAPRVHYYPWRN